MEEGEGRNDSKGGREEGKEGKLLISGLLSQREQRLQGQQAASRTFSLFNRQPDLRTHRLPGVALVVVKQISRPAILTQQLQFYNRTLIFGCGSGRTLFPFLKNTV